MITFLSLSACHLSNVILYFFEIENQNFRARVQVLTLIVHNCILIIFQCQLIQEIRFFKKKYIRKTVGEMCTLLNPTYI